MVYSCVGFRVRVRVVSRFGLFRVGVSHSIVESWVFQVESCFVLRVG